MVRALGTPTAQEALDIQNIENFIIGLQTDPIIMSALANVNLTPMLRVAIIDPVIQSRSATFFSNLPGLEISRRFQAHPAIDLIVADRGGGKRIQVEDQTIVYLLSKISVKSAQPLFIIVAKGEKVDILREAPRVNRS